MDVHCTHCRGVQKVLESAFAEAEYLDVACRSCSQIFRVVSPKLETLSIDTTKRKIDLVQPEIGPGGRVLRIPVGQHISVRVLEGADQGTVYPVVKPQMSLGRANADILVNDASASRLHCRLEIGDDGVLLRDLGSTNGTLLGDRPIQAAMLSHGSTFRIGVSLYQLQIVSRPE